MKKSTAVVLTALVASPFIATTAIAAAVQFHGSDTLFGAITDAINASGLASDLQYVGGGSGTGEAAVVAGTQGLAPMSRALTATAISQAQAKGITLTPHVLGLDGISIFVKADSALTQIDVPSLKSIFGGVDGTGSATACADAARIRDFSQIPGSKATGPIALFRRNNDSGTTDTFKNLVGVKAFCADVTIKATTDDITTATSAPNAMGYAGLSGEKVGANKSLAIAKDATAGAKYIAPSQATIRDFSYPLARRLYVVEAGGATKLSDAEQSLLANLLDRSFFDPILTSNEFVTCAATGCP